MILSCLPVFVDVIMCTGARRRAVLRRRLPVLRRRHVARWGWLTCEWLVAAAGRRRRRSPVGRDRRDGVRLRQKEFVQRATLSTTAGTARRARDQRPWRVQTRYVHYITASYVIMCRLRAGLYLNSMGAVSSKLPRSKCYQEVADIWGWCRTCRMCYEDVTGKLRWKCFHWIYSL